jgi:SAM-dependent methyltransferase
MMYLDDKALYDREYFDGYYLKDAKRGAMYLLERNRILKYASNGGNILDVGCGVGGFLATFDDRWRKNGIEPSEYAAEKAAKKDIMIHRALNVMDTASMDVIVYRGTFQHINFPMQSIAQATRILRRGGLMVFLATPDTDGIVYKVWKKLPALDADRNWILPSASMLTNIMHRLDFSVRVLHPYLDTPYASPVKDMLKFIQSLFFGWRKFAFYGSMMEMYCIKL